MNQNTKSDWDANSEEIARDQVAAYDDMRRRCPVAYSESHGFSVFRHEDVRRILADHQTFSNAVSEHLSVPNGMDPPEHTAYRKIIESYFSPQRMKAFEPACREIAADLVRDVVSKHDDVELMTEVAEHFAVRAQCAFLGWPATLYKTLIDWTARNHTATRDVDRHLLSELAREFEAIVDDLIEQREAANSGPQVDLTASLMHETIHGRRLSNEEVSSILRNWTVGEVGTISASIGILVHYLAETQDLQRQLRDELSLLPIAIDEILRVHNPLVTNRRTTTCPVQIGDRKIEAGQRITVNWISANRDESVFDDATSVRLDRDPENNLLYGAGIHVCPGAPLARMEMLVFMEELLAKTTTIELQPGAIAALATYPASGYSALPVRFSSNLRTS